MGLFVGGGCETAGMATWQQFEREAGELASVVRARFEASKSHVLATLRKDGSPRVSGTEVDFQGPDLSFGSMLGAVKAQDLRRDGRCAIHAHPHDDGDAKVAGVAVEITDPDEKRAYTTGNEPPATSTPSASTSTRPSSPRWRATNSSSASGTRANRYEPFAVSDPQHVGQARTTGGGAEAAFTSALAAASAKTASAGSRLPRILGKLSPRKGNAVREGFRRLRYGPRRETTSPCHIGVGEQLRQNLVFRSLIPL